MAQGKREENSQCRRSQAQCITGVCVCMCVCVHTMYSMVHVNMGDLLQAMNICCRDGMHLVRKRQYRVECVSHLV